MKLDFKTVFKTIYLITSIPLLIIFYCVLDNNVFNSIFIEILMTTIILNIIIIIDNIKNRDYKKYKVENPDKSKVSYLFLYLAIFSIFYIPQVIFKPIISNVNNLVLMVGVIILYAAFFIFYTGFIYKIIKDYNLNPKTFNPFKKNTNIDYMELIAYELEKLNIYQKMLVAKNRLIVINRTGIYEFVNFDKKGYLAGNINDEKWQYNDSEISNPFLLIGENIQNYFISNYKTKFILQGVGVVTRSGITILIEKNLKNNIFDDNKIDEIYEELGVKYGYHEN